MNLNDFFSPVPKDLSIKKGEFFSQLHQYHTTFPEWEESEIVMFAVPEKRGVEATNSLDQGPNAVRACLASMSLPHTKTSIVDLGNLRKGKKLADTYKKLGEVASYLHEKGKRVLVIGGSQDISMGQFMGLASKKNKVSYVHIDSRLDFEKPGEAPPISCFNSLIEELHGDKLHQYANLGYQGYFVDNSLLERLEKRDFALLRYGELAAHLDEAEPELRTADMLSFDLSAVKGADAPGAYHISPAGFSAAEACKLGQYAGLAYNLDSLSISNISSAHDLRNQTAMLGAMILWYFIHGHYHRLNDQPQSKLHNLIRYEVKLHATIEEIVFYKHKTSGRWWMEVPKQKDLGNKSSKPLLVPCSKRDYKIASSDEIPDRWWRAFNKLG